MEEPASSVNVATKATRMFSFFAVLTLWTYSAAAPHRTTPSNSSGAAQLEDRPVKFTSYKLPNGLRVVLAPDETASDVAVNISFNGGSGREDAEQAGSASLIQNLLLKNLRQEPGSGLKPFEGVLNQERASYFSEFSALQLDPMLSAFARQMRPHDISQAFINEQQSSVQNQCGQLDETRFGRVQEALLELIYQDAAFKYGAICSLPKLSPEKGKVFFTRYYVPNNAVLVIVGNLKENEARKAVAKHFGTIPRQVVPSNRNFVDQQISLERRKILNSSRAKAATYMSAYQTVASNHPDWYALNILADIIGQGSTSRLYTSLVAKSFASSVPEGMAETRGQSLLRIGAALMPQVNVEKVESIIDAEIARIQNDGVTEAEMERARSQERQYSTEQLGTALGKASFLARSTLYYDDPNRVNTELGRMLSVAPKDVQRVARRYLVKENRAVVIALPQP